MNALKLSPVLSPVLCPVCRLALPQVAIDLGHGVHIACQPPEPEDAA